MSLDNGSRERYGSRVVGLEASGFRIPGFKASSLAGCHAYLVLGEILKYKQGPWST